MKKTIVYVVIFVTFFFASLIAGLPISWVLAQVPTPPGLEITNPQGTLWKGRAANVQWQQQNLGKLNWDFQWSSLLMGKAEFDVGFGRGSDLNFKGQGFVGYGLLDGPYAEKLEVSMPVDKALQQAQLPLPVGASGRLTLKVNQATYAAPWCKSGDATLTLTQARVQSPVGELQLDEATANISCENSLLKASGSQNSSQVSAEFSGELTPEQAYSATAWFKPGAEFPQSMNEQLKWLGDPNSKGRYEFDYQGRF